MRTFFLLPAFSLATAAVACSNDSPVDVPVADASTADGPAIEGDAAKDASDAGDEKAKSCASTFGAALTDAFGRMDGTVVAVVPPAHPTCPMPNGDHVVVQVAFGGDVYRVVVNVLSTKPVDGGDTKVRFASVAHAAIGAPFVEGWHPGVTFDYVTDLALHSTDAAWMPYAMDALSGRVADALTLSAKVSVYSTSSGGASSHLVHRNKTGADGAIVVNPESASPTYLVFSFAEQTF